MKSFVVLAGIAATATTLAQVQITGFDDSGNLRWTSSLTKGLYSVESGSSPSGPWVLYSTVPDLDRAVTNVLSAQLPLTNAQAFYRVAWMYPNGVGVWDFKGYDAAGLVLTGYLSIPPITNTSFIGTWSLGYAGPETNAGLYRFPITGNGSFSGGFYLYSSGLSAYWPPNYFDNNVTVSGTILGNTWTGIWRWYPEMAMGGTFNAVRSNP